MGPITFYNVGSCSSVKVTIISGPTIPIITGSFNLGSSSDFNVIGNFTSPTSCHGTYSYHDYIGECGGTINDSGSWNASPTSMTDSLESISVSDYIEYEYDSETGDLICIKEYNLEYWLKDKRVYMGKVGDYSGHSRNGT